MSYLHIKSKTIPFYRGSIVVIISDSKDEIQKIIPEYENDHPYAHSWFYNFNGAQGFYMILNFDNKYRKIFHGTIAHEAAHLANMICKERGIKLDTDNDEAYAYLVEWIIDEVYKIIKQYGFEVR